MKKLLQYTCGFLCLLMSFGLFSCSSGNKEPSIDNKKYSISCEVSDYYVYEGTVNSTSGLTANFTIRKNYPAFEVARCTYNGKDCTKGEENETGASFSFVMPSEDVEIKVIAKWNDLAASGSNNFLSFDVDNKYTAKTTVNEDNYNNDEYWGTPLIIAFNTDAGYMTVANITCFSSDETILPNNAINVTKKTDSNSNTIVGGKIIIDRSKANAGSTQIVLHVKSENSSTYDAVIVATVTFTD